MNYINEEKINKIKLSNNNFYVVIDFDKTITSYESEDSWDVTGRATNNINCDKEIESLYKKYRPIELDYTITKEEKNAQMEKWYNEWSMTASNKIKGKRRRFPEKTMEWRTT